MRYATIDNWGEYFQKEGIQISRASISNRLRIAGIIGVAGKCVSGRFLKNGFYSEEKIRLVCGDLLKINYQADKSGFFELSNMKYGTVFAWSHIVKVDPRVIKKQIDNSDITHIKGKDNKGRIQNFYSESDIGEICAPLSQDMPVADDNGFIEKGGDKFGTYESWSRLLGLPSPTIKRRLKGYNETAIKGKIRGQIYTFYSYVDVLEACGDIIKEMPQADENGYFEKDGIKFGTIASWEKVLPISAQAIRNKLRSAKISGVEGKTKTGQIYEFYSEQDINNACKDVFENLPIAGEDGFFEIDKLRFGTIRSWTSVLPVSTTAILKRLKKYNKEGIKAKTYQGAIYTYYSDIDIYSVCLDIFSRRYDKAMPQVSNNSHNPNAA